MSVTMKQLETELITVCERVKNLEAKLEKVDNKKGNVSSNVSRLADSVVELKQNFNLLHASVQEKIKVLYEQVKK